VALSLGQEIAKVGNLMSVLASDMGLIGMYGIAGMPFLAAEAFYEAYPELSDKCFRVAEEALACIHLVQLAHLGSLFYSWKICGLLVIGRVLWGLEKQFPLYPEPLNRMYGTRFQELDSRRFTDLESLGRFKVVSLNIRFICILAMLSLYASLYLTFALSPFNLLGLGLSIYYVGRKNVAYGRPLGVEYTHSENSLPGLELLPKNKIVAAENKNKSAIGSYTISHRFDCFKTPQVALDKDPSLAPVQFCQQRNQFITSEELKKRLEARSLEIANLVNENISSLHIHYDYNECNEGRTPAIDKLSLLVKIKDKKVSPLYEGDTKLKIQDLFLKGKIKVNFNNKGEGSPSDPCAPQDAARLESAAIFAI